MLRKLPPLALIASALMITSCHKSNMASPGGSAQLIGNYKFLFANANIQAVDQESAGGQTEKTISNNQYQTTNNAGTITFTKDSIAWKGITYSADYTVFGYVYINGTLADSVTFPFSESLAPVNATTKFDVIGQDSIYIHGGYPTLGFGGNSSGGTAIAPPSGGRFSFKGDTLFLTSKVFQTYPPQVISGVNVTSYSSGVVVMAMLKQ